MDLMLWKNGKIGKEFNMENKEELLNLLGVYYDSRQDKIDQIPEVLEKSKKITVVLRESSGWNNGNLSFSYVVGNNNNNSKITNVSCLQEAFLNEDRHFMIDKSGQVEKTDIKININDKELIYKDFESIKNDKVLASYLSQGGVIGCSLDFNIEAKIQCNKAARERYFKTLFNIPENLEDHVNKLCAVGLSNDRPWGYSTKNSLNKFKGKICQAIWELTKPQTIEAANRLYGLNIRKSYNLRKVHQMLSYVNYTNFGINDVAKLDSILNAIYDCRYHDNINKLHDVLDELNVGKKPESSKKKDKNAN